MNEEALVRELRERLGALNVPEAIDICISNDEAMTKDWTRRFGADHGVVLRPRTDADVAAIVRAAEDLGVGIVTQGGNTSLVGGSTPANGEIIVSMADMVRSIEVDRGSKIAHVTAPVTLSQLERELDPLGLSLNVDLGSRDQATIGGMMATNAGGLEVMAFGDMRAHVVDLEVIVGGGRVLGGRSTLRKRNVGYHLPSIFVGSEGTLGIMTSGVLALHPKTRGKLVTAINIDSVADLLEMSDMVSQLEGVRSFEFASKKAIDEVRTALDRPFAISEVSFGVVFVVMEIDRDWGHPQLDRLGRVIGDRISVVGESDQRGFDAIWSFRDRIPFALNRYRHVVKCDVSVPLHNLEHFVTEAAYRCDSSRIQMVWFGHLGDANLHVNLVSQARSDVDKLTELEDSIYELALAHGGSVSGEHGIGRAKIQWAARQRGEGETALLRELKAVFDSRNVFNPGVLFHGLP